MEGILSFYIKKFEGETIMKTDTYRKMTLKERDWEEWKKLVILANSFAGYMHNILEEREGVNFSISRKTATEEDVKQQQLSAMFSGSYGEFRDFVAGTYTRLTTGFSVVMSDTPMEIRTNLDFLYQAHGHVLIAGLGLGVILKILEKRKGIKSVTVIEKNQEVIDLVLDQLNLPDNFKVIQSDIFDYEPTEKFDTIYFDIWTNICSDNWEEMKTLRKKFKKFLDLTKKDWWIGSWRQEYCREQSYGKY